MSQRGFVQALSTTRFLNLGHFSDDVERHIKEASKKQKDNLELISQEITDQYEQEQFWENANDRVYQLDNEYPNILRSTLIIACITNVEKTLQDLYDDLILQKNIPLGKFNNKKGSKIEKIIATIHDKIPLNDLYCSSKWDDLIFFIQIRNHIVHEGGRVSQSDKTYAQIKSSELLSIDEYDYLVYKENIANIVNYTCNIVLKLIFKDIYQYLRVKASH